MRTGLFFPHGEIFAFLIAYIQRNNEIMARKKTSSCDGIWLNHFITIFINENESVERTIYLMPDEFFNDSPLDFYRAIILPFRKDGQSKKIVSYIKWNNCNE